MRLTNMNWTDGRLMLYSDGKIPTANETSPSGAKGNNKGRCSWLNICAKVSVVERLICLENSACRSKKSPAKRLNMTLTKMKMVGCGMIRLEDLVRNKRQEILAKYDVEIRDTRTRRLE